MRSAEDLLARVRLHIGSMRHAADIVEQEAQQDGVYSTARYRRLGMAAAYRTEAEALEQEVERWQTQQ